MPPAQLFSKNPDLDGLTSTPSAENLRKALT